MYWKIVRVFLFLLLGVVFYAYNEWASNDNPVPPPPRPEEVWQKWVEKQHGLGNKVLNVLESEAWIEKYRDEIDIPNQIAFGKPYTISEFPLSLLSEVLALR